MLIGYINTDSPVQYRADMGGVHVLQGVKEGLKSFSQTAFSSLDTVFGASKEAVRVCAFKEFLQPCVLWMHGGGGFVC